MKVSNEFASATELGGRGGIHGFGATSYVSSKEIDATPNIDQHVTGVDVNNNMTDITSTIGNVNSHTYASSHMNVNADDILSSMKEVNVDNFSQNDGAAGLYNNEVMADTSTSMQWNNGTTTRNCKEINYDPQPEMSDDSRTSSKALDVSSTYGSTNYTSSLNFMNNYYENKPSGGNFNGATDFISNDKKIETTNDINDVIKQYSKSGYQTFEVKN
ncbi:hypothetical protein SNEBB_011221 [Seison nebaliae]|nr:hypothetical protein SNEBB_011221 [Seison nebaliae]